MDIYKHNWAVDVAFTHAVLILTEADAFKNSPPARELVNYPIPPCLLFLFPLLSSFCTKYGYVFYVINVCMYVCMYDYLK